MPDIRVVSAESFGAACLQALLDAVVRLPNPVVGLPTGSTPVAFYEHLRAAVERGETEISSWQPFAIDEYGGPRNHPCSNRAFFERYWDVIPGAPGVVQFDPEASNPEADIERVAAALASAGGLTVALLGIGTNGHLAFNEPGSAPDSTVRKVALHEASRVSGARCWAGESPAWGLTLGLRELLAAPTVIVMANGAAKASIVARAIDGPETADCPASFVRRSPHATWVVDEAAASMLRR